MKLFETSTNKTVFFIFFSCTSVKYYSNQSFDKRVVLNLVNENPSETSNKTKFTTKMYGYII